MQLPAALIRSEVEPWLRKLPADIPERLDLSGIQRIDSVGVTLLLELSRQALRQGRPLRLCDPSPQAMRLLRFFELEDVLGVEASASENASSAPSKDFHD